jgi:polar amino acid transport system permease protein
VRSLLNRRKTSIAIPDAALTLLLLSLFGYFIFYISTNIHYQWNWSAIPGYMFRYDDSADKWIPSLLMEGFFTTIRLSFWATILAVIIGTIMGVVRTSQSLFMRMIGRTYVEFIRNIPPLVLIFIFYFFISDQILTALKVDSFIRSLSDGQKNILTVLFSSPAHFSSFLSALITLAIYEGAYITEIVRSGFESVEKNQWEASYALGLSWWQQVVHIIFPQAVPRILPPLAGQLISTIKDSAIVSVISIQELTFQGLELMATTYLTFEIWITITALYFILTFSCSMAVRKLELYMRRNDPLI